MIVNETLSVIADHVPRGFQGFVVGTTVIVRLQVSHVVIDSTTVVRFI